MSENDEMDLLRDELQQILKQFQDELSGNQDEIDVEEINGYNLKEMLVGTGLKFNIKDGYEMQVRPKSGLALKQGLTVLNTPGTVDSGYDGEVKVILYNSTQTTIYVEKGQKIAQACICPVVNGRWIETKEVSEINGKDRGDNGFGSTGI